MREQMDLAALMPLIDEVIAAGGAFRLYPRGTSMLPMLTEGEDAVELVAAEPYAVGDVLLYRRASGQFVLHRLIGVHKGALVFCGDNQRALEFGVPRTAVLAKLGGYYKGDVHHTLDEPDYVRYAKERVTRFPRACRKHPALERFVRRVTPLHTLPRRALHKLRRMLKIEK
ncbi:MAG: hypothetical protein DBX93_08060 [Oscillospiraceae bacterium]|nr:MAG: hypothetical protein DBX93_08060 [Oscillospiraceae bacterium]